MPVPAYTVIIILLILISGIFLIIIELRSRYIQIISQEITIYLQLFIRIDLSFIIGRLDF